MNASFITIAQAMQLTGKSRRTIQRLVESLTKSQPDRVMKEKTDRGYIWKISEQSVRQAYAVSGAPAGTVHPVNHQQTPAPVVTTPPEKYIEVALQGYAGMMGMHQEVKQVYEERLKEKDKRIAELTQDLEQSRKGFWAWLVGR